MEPSAVIVSEDGADGPKPPAWWLGLRPYRKRRAASGRQYAPDRYPHERVGRLRQPQALVAKKPEHVALSFGQARVDRLEL